MTYRIELETRARREYVALRTELRERIDDAIDDLGRNPRPRGAKRIHGRAGYRVRVGDYRVLYTVDDQKRTIQVYRIGNRRDVYRRL